MDNLMELKDTVDMMLSDDYKERFKAEYYQLKNRYVNLKFMTVRWDNGMLDFKPTCDRSIYDYQLVNMKRYMDILEKRAEIEGIEL